MTVGFPARHSRGTRFAPEHGSMPRSPTPLRRTTPEGRPATRPNSLVRSLFARRSVRHECPRRRRDTRPAVAAELLLRQLRLERIKQREHVLLARTVAHKPDPPHLTLEVPEAAADLDVVLEKKPLAQRHLVDSFGDAHRRQRRQPVLLLDVQRQPHSLDAGPERPRVPQVAHDPRLQPLFEYNSQALA